LQDEASRVRHSSTDAMDEEEKEDDAEMLALIEQHNSRPASASASASASSKRLLGGALRVGAQKRPRIVGELAKKRGAGGGSVSEGQCSQTEAARLSMCYMAIDDSVGCVQNSCAAKNQLIPAHRCIKDRRGRQGQLSRHKSAHNAGF
jgi:hypothetical protein